MNKGVIEGYCPDAVTVEVRRVEAAEVDEMWSFVGSKAHQRWLWHAIDHLTGLVLAYVLGTRADAVFKAARQNNFPLTAKEMLRLGPCKTQ